MTTEDDKRVWQRFIVDGRQALLRESSQKVHEVLVCNNSFGGLGVQIKANELELRAGDCVEVTVPEGSVSATVRFIAQDPEGVWHLGLEWEQRGSFRVQGEPWISGDGE